MGKPWSELTAREKDARVATALGWVLVDETPHPEHRKRGQATDLWYQEPGGMLWRIPHNRKRIDPATDFCPTVSLDRARLVLDQIARRGLIEPYQSALIAVLNLDMQVYQHEIVVEGHHPPEIPENSFSEGAHAFLWVFSHATPDQVCEAAVTVLEAG